MHKFSTALAVWAIFIFLTGLLFPLEMTSGAGQVTQVLHSYTVYGFFSMIPIVFYGGFLSFMADWIAKHYNHFQETISLSIHMMGGFFVYVFTVNIDITILAVVATILFFIVDRALLLLEHRNGGVQLANGLSLFVGCSGVMTMIIASTL
ncbi:hypothetical protein JCM19037_3972 [Geomicrobium sp. JCM 19037]|uniref:hypothetical protein n=1 Tax=unclassified Geomicrobium TaxID=2628951 RepID=UPI00045F4927|nr:hypothetical protein [Geomicrobium sp. JCM 19037]GAK05472.1 hypothetical protein JCM19037_3972 [Geomicrobium sp. JCM 19037]